MSVLRPRVMYLISHRSSPLTVNVDGSLHHIKKVWTGQRGLFVQVFSIFLPYTRPTCLVYCSRGTTGFTPVLDERNECHQKTHKRGDTTFPQQLLQFFRTSMGISIVTILFLSHKYKKISCLSVRPTLWLVVTFILCRMSTHTITLLHTVHRHTGFLSLPIRQLQGMAFTTCL